MPIVIDGKRRSLLPPLISGVLKTQTSKTLTPDQRNSNLRVSRNLRPKKYNIFTPRECRKPTCLLFVDTVALPKSAEKRKTAHSVRNVQWSWKLSAEKRKNSLQTILYPQRVVSLEAIREVCCVMVSCTNTRPASRDRQTWLILGLHRHAIKK